MPSEKIIYGDVIARKIREEIKVNTENLFHKTGRKPGIAVILVGDNPASEVYVRMKQKAAVEAGMHSVVIKLDSETTQETLLETILNLNKDNCIDGILVQLPLPQHIDEKIIIQSIKPEKDVDGFHPLNIGRMQTGEKTLYPCTPYGIMKMFEYKGIEVAGKHAVIAGRSNIVGKPMANLLLNNDATVTICHSKTKSIKEITKSADIFIAAIGKPNMFDKSYFKKGVVVIDVGINRLDGKLTGDVDFNDVLNTASAITPVPKGVGPMTIAMLMYNTLEAYKNILNI